MILLNGSHYRTCLNRVFPRRSFLGGRCRVERSREHTVRIATNAVPRKEHPEPDVDPLGLGDEFGIDDDVLLTVILEVNRPDVRGALFDVVSGDLYALYAVRSSAKLSVFQVERCWAFCVVRQGSRTSRRVDRRPRSGTWSGGTP